MSQEYKRKATALLDEFINITVADSRHINVIDLGRFIQAATAMKDRINPPPQQVRLPQQANLRVPPPPQSASQPPPASPPPAKRSRPAESTSNNPSCYCGQQITTSTDHDHYKSVYHVRHCERQNLICDCQLAKPKIADGNGKLICRTCGKMLLICSNDDNHESTICDTVQTRLRTIQKCSKTHHQIPSERRFHLTNE